MADPIALGSLAAFSGWNHPREWGADGTWRVAFGSGKVVIDDLVAGLTELPALVKSRWSRRADAVPVVLGCTPWFTSLGVAQALATMNSCIVVDKKGAASGAVRFLTAADRPVWQMTLGMWDWAPRDEHGRPAIIGPYGPLPGEERELGPVRVVGFRETGGRSPLLHAKLAVCGAAWFGEGEFGEEFHTMTPLKVWLGSANWTAGSATHIEFGAWTTDEALCGHALEFMKSVIKASEPLDSLSSGPLPEMSEAEYDDIAMAEAAADMWNPDDDHLADDDIEDDI